jgi:hypothetical protein
MMMSNFFTKGHWQKCQLAGVILRPWFVQPYSENNDCIKSSDEGWRRFAGMVFRHTTPSTLVFIIIAQETRISLFDRNRLPVYPDHGLWLSRRWERCSRCAMRCVLLNDHFLFLPHNKPFTFVGMYSVEQEQARFCCNSSTWCFHLMDLLSLSFS